MQKDLQDPVSQSDPEGLPPMTLFEKRTERWVSEVAQWDRRINRLSNWRLVLFLLGVAAIVLFALLKMPAAAWIFGLVFFGLFILLVVLHEKAFQRRAHAQALLDVNRMSWQRLSGEWHALPDNGQAYLDLRHPYAGDLDVFGAGSLFQWCNTAVTPAGKARLADWFSRGEQNATIIRSRQEAVRELAPLLDWRQELQANALAFSGKFCDAQALAKWGTQGAAAQGETADGEAASAEQRGDAGCLSQAQLRVMRLLAFMVPTATMLCAILPTLLRGVLPGFGYGPLGLLLIVEILLLIWRWKAVSGCLRAVEQAAADIRVHQALLSRFEALPVEAALLNQMKADIRDDHGRSASAQAERLAGIVDALGNRHHQLYIIADILLLFDWHFVFAIERWRTESGKRLGTWVDVNAELEALCALAAVAHAHPDWTMPQVLEADRQPQVSESQTQKADTPPQDDAGLRLLAEDAGHPLIGDACVANTVRFSQTDRIALITGSNMSGKSTLLRTIGINLVLAMAGGPVRAIRFAFRPGHIYTCMRTQDDIEQGISSFYAELLRVKLLVKAVESGEPVFFLLDELFKGTNSVDRHAGAEALMRWLVRQDSPERPVLGLISTHDLELGSLEQTCPGVRNAHFQEWYEDGKVRFDYQLRPGVSTTRNALWLMKLAGLPIDEVNQ